MTHPEYKTQDRSILLPLYKRWLVEPLVERLPAKLSPNAISHAGHLINLAALVIVLITQAERGMWLIAAGLLVQLYVICDNADGTHARRTGQTSAYGELLDHGLDTLNVAYIACMSAYALGLAPMWWVVLVALVTGASALTFFEQTQTGTFVLGRLNQQEASAMLTAVLFVSAVLGRAWWADTILIGNISAQFVVFGVGCASLVTAMVRSTSRVVRVRGLSSALPVVIFVSWNLAVFAAAQAGVVSTRVALIVALASNTFFACRMLVRRHCNGGHPPRLAGPTPPAERTLIAASVAFFVCVVSSFVSLGALHEHVDTAFCIVATGLFVVAMLRDARRGIHATRGARPA